MAVEVSDTTPVESRGQLVSWMMEGCKPAAGKRIGTEHEKFAFNPAGMKPAPYQSNGIAALLQNLADDLGWEKIIQDGNLIGLLEPRSKAAVSLEPGGQVELSGAPFLTLHETSEEIDAHLAAVKKAGAGLNLSFIALGFWPADSLADMPRMPKRRYDIMRAYMPKVGTMGLDMMHRTATVQANVDFSSEAEMVMTMRIGMALQPIASALFAASPFSQGRPNGFKTIRPEIWQHTDPDRCGILPFVFEPGMSFARYVDWALDVPMYFVKRGEIYHDVAGVPFRALLEGRVPQLARERATLADWVNHLGTLFPEVRLKHYIEMRGADSGPPDYLKALPALWTGLLHHDAVRSQAFELIKNWTAEDVIALYRSVPRQGFSAMVQGRSSLDVARDVVSLAEQGLRARARKNAQGETEGIYLQVLMDRIASGRTLSDEWLEKFHGPWQGQIAPLLEEHKL